MTTRLLPGRAVRLAALAGLALAASAAAPTGASAQDLIVKYDQASIVRLSRPATEIIVGNPSIADVSVQNGTSLVITGKSFGVTNIIAVDAQGQVIRDQRIMVRVDDERIVHLHKGTQRSTFNCAPACQTTLTIGDETAHFKAIADNVAGKLKVSETASDHSSGGQ
jgi:Flp pilus assembly secretin CpaC